MIGLTVREALSKGVVRVASDERPRARKAAWPHDTVFAVFEGNGDALPEAACLGLVDSRQAALFPQRIFADLLPSEQPRAIPVEAPLENAQQRLLDEEVYALAVVDDRGRFIGAVTRDSLLMVLRERAREVVNDCEHCLDLAEQQRSLLAFELHDGLVQYAMAAHMHFQTCAAASETPDVVSSDHFGRGMLLLEEAIREARAMIHGLHPPGLEAGGVTAAIAALVDQRRSPTGPSIDFEHALGEVVLSKSQEIAVYRIAQEALANALRHSDSDRIRIKLGAREEVVRLSIRDWGSGFDPNAAPTGHGMTGIRRRARSLQGRAITESSPEKGTQIVVEFPVA